MNERLLREIWRVFHSLEFSSIQYINHRRWIAFISLFFSPVQSRFDWMSTSIDVCILLQWFIYEMLFIHTIFVCFFYVMLSRYGLCKYIPLIFITFYVTAECCAYVSNSLISPEIVQRISTHILYNCMLQTSIWND